MKNDEQAIFLGNETVEDSFRRRMMLVLQIHADTDIMANINVCVQKQPKMSLSMKEHQIVSKYDAFHS